MTCYVRYPGVQDITGVPSEGYSPFYFAPASEGGSTLPFHFTDESFTRVFSALVNGAFMTYGPTGEAHQVIWDFLVNVEYPVSFCDQVAQAILTCEDVQAALATVIAAPGPVQDAIVDMLQSSDEFNTFITQQVMKLTGEQIAGKFTGGDCSNSVVAGRMVAIVERLNTNNEDFFEIVEVGTNDEERVSAVISAIPGLSEAPVDEIIDLLQSLLENLAENYSAAITEGWKDEVERDLYCLAKESDDCSLTYQQLFDYFRNRAGADLTIGSLIKNVIDYVINGDFSSDELVASGMYTIQLGFILTGQDFAGLNLPLIGAITRDALPSTKWEDWDPCVAEWCYVQNLASSITNIVLDYDQDGFPYRTAWDSGVGIVGDRPGALDENIPKIVLPVNSTLTRVEFTIDVVPGASGYLGFIAVNGSFYTPIARTATGLQTFTFDVDESDVEFVMFGVDRGGGDTSVIGTLKSIRLEGTGENPFGENNC